MVLADTNIFLEILLKQDKKEDCKKFLKANAGNIHITDFSLHSIGVVCFRYGKEEVFQEFIEDILPHVEVETLPMDNYQEVVDNKKKLNLDFDDSYQYTTAKNLQLKIATMDRDFKKVEDIEIIFL
ncbi:MAG: PIN domain-containing protein [Candidatus Aminicenantes bacterium]|nr:PIN domain-containing protein [Candidatus Aminicenantes bacterium]